MDFQKEIARICRASQDGMDRHLREEGGLSAALAKAEPHETLWKQYRERAGGPVTIEGGNFRGLLFAQSRLENHRFLNCDFSQSRWIFFKLSDCDCSGSNFSGCRTMLMPFEKTNCTNCNFSGAVFLYFAPFEKCDFSGANFTGSRLVSSHSFFDEAKLEEASRFTGAIMTGCQLVIKAEKAAKSEAQLRSVLEKLFTAEQLADMVIDYTGSSGAGVDLATLVRPAPGTSGGCFIATAACGPESEEVRVLRSWRDQVLLGSRAGRRLARLYSRVSPPLARWLEGSARARRVVRRCLIKPVARLVRGGQE